MTASQNTRVIAVAVALVLGACAAPAPKTGPGGDALSAAFDCARERGAVLVSAHRGGPAPGFPENALETLAQTHAAGVALLEVDIRRAAGGTLVLMHDQTLERTTTGTGDVSRTSLSALEGLRLEDAAGAVSGFGVPTLEETLRWAETTGALLQLDIKRDTPIADVVDAVRRVGAQERVILIVYTQEDARTVARMAPDLMMSASVSSLAELETLRAGGVDPSRVLAWTGTGRPDPELWGALRALGIEPIFGTLGGRDSLDERIEAQGDDGEYAELARQGLAVIATDRPLAARAALEAARVGPSQAQACFSQILTPPREQAS